MKEKTLLKLAIICAVLGTSLLVVLAERIEVKQSNMDDLDDGDDAKVKGIVRKVSNKGNLTFLEIETVQTVKALAFDEVDIEENSYIEAVGSVQEYEGEKELVIDRIIQ
jgi:hypothetical protein